ncbi:LysR family transcriptional regulator [Thalassobius vesicularis]|uniref:HTH-type transcriptional regulator CbbR n=1 Tax=Thalassobius vesicularis TaxID=1294297 RepID=A0A4S3M8J7_9RHOB|nr:LysR family transcriptional regulator [Thalassobius vesicularis]THD73865.1 LysR family transcriptional regulator [Thalassobius vesicularis]
MPIKEAITIKQLRALRAVAENGSIAAAADILGLTPPAVHTQLKTLESNLDCVLIERHTSGRSSLTAEGRAVLTAERNVDTALDTCIEKLRALKAGLSGVVVLGVVSTGKYFAPSLVSRLRDAYPDIDVILKVGNRDMTINTLQQRSIDLAIMGRPPRSPAVLAESIGDHPHVIIAKPDHPLAQLSDVPADDLLNETFIARENGSGTRILMTRYLDRIGNGTPYRCIEMGSNETIKQAVMAGLGVAMISGHTVTEELRTGRLAVLQREDLPIIRQWFLLHREDLELTPVIETVRAYISAQQGGFLPC